MKALFLNGSPRKNWNTHKLLESAINGAAEAGAETELVHLYDLNFKGCKSCFACKLKNNKTNGLCVIRDDLRPVLEKAREAEIVVVGTPIYISFSTGVAREFLERFIFAPLSYAGKDSGFKKATAMIYTMNCPEDLAAKFNYDVILNTEVATLKRIFSYCEMLGSYDTYQFNDYSKYDVTMFNPEHKAEHRDKQFPIDLENAFNLGKRLVEVASKL